jgi:hypothetical protein
MSKTGMLIAPAEYRDWFNRFKREVETDDVQLRFADSVAALTPIFAAEEIEFVLLGDAKGDPEWRFEILRAIFTLSPTTSVHCKGADDDGEQFVKNVLAGFVPWAMPE